MSKPTKEFMRLGKTYNLLKTCAPRIASLANAELFMKYLDTAEHKCDSCFQTLSMDKMITKFHREMHDQVEQNIKEMNNATS